MGDFRWLWCGSAIRGWREGIRNKSLGAQDVRQTVSPAQPSGASSSLSSPLQGGGSGLPTSHAKDIELPQACCFGITLKGQVSEASALLPDLADMFCCSILAPLCFGLTVGLQWLVLLCCAEEQGPFPGAMHF